MTTGAAGSDFLSRLSLSKLRFFFSAAALSAFLSASSAELRSSSPPKLVMNSNLPFSPSAPPSPSFLFLLPPDPSLSESLELLLLLLPLPLDFLLGSRAA